MDEIPPLSIWETDMRYKRHAEMWKQVDDYITGRSVLTPQLIAVVVVPFLR